MSETKALDISNLHAGYGETEILKGINLSVKPSEIVAIIGPNGAGKSTVVKSVLGLLNVISGNISLNGKNIVGIAPDKAIKLGISYVPQTHNIFPNLTITENLEMGAWTRTTGISERIEEMFELFPDLKVKRNKVAGSLWHKMWGPSLAPAIYEMLQVRLIRSISSRCLMLRAEV